MAFKNPLEAMGLFPDLFTSFLEKNKKLELAKANRYCSMAFGANLDEETYGILMDLQQNNWVIKIHLEGRRLTRLYMRKEDNTTGDIPESICHFKTLKVLVIRRGYSAYISGGIPKNIGELTNLELFDARNADITSGFPESMVRMTKLRSLVLSGNTITEDIPSTWFGEKGPLRADDSNVNIWRRVQNGWPHYYRGSILEMPEEERTTPFTLADPDSNEWISQPLLCRSMAIQPITMWYGVEFV
jgi:hypothetical protein